MPLIRDDLAAQAYRWHEALIGAGVAALGLWAGLGSSGLLSWLGWMAVLLGAALMLSGVQRARFRQPPGVSPGPGVVQVTEGQIAYFGPLTGGAVALDAVTTLSLDGSGTPAHWLLDHAGGPPLAIPVTATGAETLFDAFEQLPNLPTEQVLRALEHGAPERAVLWRRGAPPVSIAPSRP
jgi:hypothetical protein